jgi:DNA polymerase-3 subunit chi
MTKRVTFYDIPNELRFGLVAKLAAAALNRDKRMLIRCHPQEAAAIDQHLWTYREESFFPHEIADDPQRLLDHEARVVITTRDARVIDADILLQLAPCDLVFARDFESVIDLVDHGDEARLAASRQRYKAWSEVGIKPDLKKSS